MQLELVVRHLVNCRLKLSTKLCPAISNDEEHFASGGREGIPTVCAVSGDGLVVDKLDAVPSVNERISIVIVSVKSWDLSNWDSKIKGTVSPEAVWTTIYKRRR